MADETVESIAADLGEEIYEHWLAAAESGFLLDHAGIEALVVLIDSLRACEANPQLGATQMRAARAALKKMAPFAGQGELRAAMGIDEQLARRARKTGA